MGFSKKIATSLATLALLGHVNAELPSIVKKGTKFFYENGTQFFIKGVAYQQHTGAGGSTTDTDFVDPLADETSCTRDVPLLAALGTNTIRTYAIDPTADHSACMKLLDAAGIYVISDLSQPSLSIEQDNPAWDTELYSRYTSVIDELSQYSNVIGFFAGNEVTNNASNTEASAFVKAAVRDMKAYITDKNYRWMGVGYAANDDADIRANIAHYFNCGEDDQSIDFWGYNIYEWCGESTFEKSGYAAQVEFFKNYSVPVFFAEYGCNSDGAANRIFQETTALYSDDMTGVISGGIVYMYFEEANDYGLVTISGTKASTLADYNDLKTRVASATPSSTSMDAYTPTNSAAACPDVSDDWQASSNLPPTPDADLCACMYKTLSCVPSPSLNTTAYSDIFSYLCDPTGPNACGAVTANATTGVYGAFSMCNATEKLGKALDTYFLAQDSDSTACDFDGQATTTSASADTSCSKAVASASSTSSSGSSSTSSNVASPIPMKNLLTLGDLAVGLYAVVAMGAGAAMVLL